MMRHCIFRIALWTLLFAITWAPPALSADYVQRSSLVDVDKGSAGTLALDGEFVHNVGQLQVNITNWGLIGSHPGRGFRCHGPRRR